MSRERALNFDQCQTFFANYKPIRVCLRIVHKITEKNFCSRLFLEFFQTKTRYPAFFDKVSILT